MRLGDRSAQGCAGTRAPAWWSGLAPLMRASASMVYDKSNLETGTLRTFAHSCVFRSQEAPQMTASEILLLRPALLLPNSAACEFLPEYLSPFLGHMGLAFSGFFPASQLLATFPNTD